LTSSGQGGRQDRPTAHQRGVSVRGLAFEVRIVAGHIIGLYLDPPQHAAVFCVDEKTAKVQFHFTPTYSSWLNQVELWFAKIQRDVIAGAFLPRSPIWPANCENTSAPTPNPPDPFAGLILTPGAASVLTKSPGQLTRSPNGRLGSGDLHPIRLTSVPAAICKSCATFGRYPLSPVAVGTSTRRRLDRRLTKLG